MADGPQRHKGGARDTGSGSWIPWLFVAFFAVVFAANGVLIYLAVDTWTGIETENHYDRGLAYNQDLAGARAQAELGWQVDIALTPLTPASAGDPRAELAVTLRDRDGRALADGELRARFIRPTHAGVDSEVVLRNLGGGRYGGEVAVPLPGQWDVVVLGSVNGVTYQAVRRVYLPR
jgi:nitrogen fixation protein FixH